ncbi:nucleoside hydrolase-like [Phascolarctos cinereus]|uniref:Inosine-uridine preferring nucleoside hydrolase-like n=1 Tax=Phascolarctos cinereus TaxID=38626 RepID=A0A6P5KY89_PHACI|nr:inosine-uridine preferring nucleoside hydrolase-like [Phascolarctos cinereus]XP_020848391.1 inosine-uridine preferring nucleoside hydrolase-like [Phascolarctos cinereus]
MEKKFLLVDVDAGVDDAAALMMALAAPNVEILGITCCFGNTTVENVCKNVLRVLKKCNHLQIPVYQGASSPLLNTMKKDYFYGTDGLGDVPDADAPGFDQVQQEHAVAAMIRIISERPNKVTLVATGPLTNIALAVKMDPTFPKKIKNMSIMGGNMYSRGNIDICAEFNFAADPEAAYIVLNEYTCPTAIATWEFASSNSLPWEFYEKCTSQDSEKARFLKEIYTVTIGYQKRPIPKLRALYRKPGFVSCDCFAMAAAIDEDLVTESMFCAVSVELTGSHTRGMMILDIDDRLQKKNKVSIAKELDVEKFKGLLMAALK